jgi:hypothetical protein
MKSRLSHLRLFLFFLGAGTTVALIGTTLAAQPQVTVVMSGLDNPRGLAIGPEGALYVAEAGRGGPGPCGLNAPGETRCYGPTGAITRLWRGEQERIAEGLPSHALVSGAAAQGPNDISFQGRGGAFVTIGLGSDASLRAALGAAGPLFGTLFQVNASGGWKVDADVSAYEFAANPGGGPIDTNPYGVLAAPAGSLVADAGANALLRVDANGKVTVVATFPSRAQGRSTDAVPTAVVAGPDGAYYVSELSGVPFAAGAAQIYRVVPGAAPQVYLTGFKTITDLAFDEDGNLYVVEHASGPVFFGGPGRLLKVAPDGTRTTVIDDLDRPTSAVVGLDGEIYVTNHGITPGAGEVLRIDQ